MNGPPSALKQHKSLVVNRPVFTDPFVSGIGAERFQDEFLFGDHWALS